MAKKISKMTTKNESMRICIDRVIPDEYNPARAEAQRVILQNTAAEIAATRALDPSGVIHPRAALVNFKKWENGRTLRCHFLDGDATQCKKVEAKAHIWEQYANIKFQFVPQGDAEIRISFSADAGSWSAVGTDALIERYFPRFQPTMNYGWLKADTDDQEYERVVIHEFGHALGLIHEHQSPKAKLKWNRAEVYRVFSGAPNFWNKAAIDSNILQKYLPFGISATTFDPDSIMLYMFPGSLFQDGKPTNSNTHLSDQDKAFIRQMYPKP